MCACQERENWDVLRAKTEAEVSVMWGNSLETVTGLRGEIELLKVGQETACQPSQLDSSGLRPQSPEV